MTTPRSILYRGQRYVQFEVTALKLPKYFYHVADTNSKEATLKSILSKGLLQSKDQNLNGYSSKAVFLADSVESTEHYTPINHSSKDRLLFKIDASKLSRSKFAVDWASLGDNYLGTPFDEPSHKVDEELLEMLSGEYGLKLPTSLLGKHIKHLDAYGKKLLDQKYVHPTIRYLGNVPPQAITYMGTFEEYAEAEEQRKQLAAQKAWDKLTPAQKAKARKEQAARRKARRSMRRFSLPYRHF